MDDGCLYDSSSAVQKHKAELIEGVVFNVVYLCFMRTMVYTLHASLEICF